MPFKQKYLTSDFAKTILRRSKKLLPALIYIVWFWLLERMIPEGGDYIIMHCKIDDYIPFCEYFLVPYYLWFPLIAFVFVYFLFTSERDFTYCCHMIIGGMLVALAICTLIPNGQDLRPDISSLPDTFFGNLAAKLYETDTCTNVCPSVHVYNSVAACVVIWQSRKFRNNDTVKLISVILAVAISLSTMFLKQHSFIDVICALTLAYIMYLVVYKRTLARKMSKKGVYTQKAR